MGSEAVWYWKSTGLRIQGLNLALGTASNSSVTLTKATSHSWTHFVPILGSLHAQDARMHGWWALDWQLKGSRGLGKQGEETQPQSLHIAKRGTETDSTQKTAKGPVSSGTGDSSVAPCGHTTLRQIPT